MIGLGFRPFQAAALNLIANTAPVAWGAIGTPIHTLAAVSGLPESDLNAMIGRILPFVAILVPFWLVRTIVNWQGTFEVLPAILVVGVSFSLTQFLWSNYIDSNLVDIVGGVVSPLTVVVTLLSAQAILLEAALSFLGLGVTQPQASWGGMLQRAQSLTILESMPWLWLPPGIAIAVTVLAINFVGDGLRDALDPRQQM